MAREAKEACLNTLSVVEMEMDKFDGSSIPDTLGKIKIERIKENSKKNRECVQSAIKQVDHVDLQMINDLLGKQILQHQVIAQVVVKIQETLSQKGFLHLS